MRMKHALHHAAIHTFVYAYNIKHSGHIIYWHMLGYGHLTLIFAYLLP